MMSRIGRHVVPLALLTLAATSCGRSAISRFYTLDSVATPDAGPLASYAIVVGPGTVPSSVDRPEFVVQVSPNRVAVDEFNRWAGPLDDNIARVVAGNLSVLLGTSRVARTPLVSFDPAYRVTLDIQRFESTPGQSVLIEAAWTVRPSAGGETSSGRTVAS